MIGLKFGKASGRGLKPNGTKSYAKGGSIVTFAVCRKRIRSQDHMLRNTLSLFRLIVAARNGIAAGTKAHIYVRVFAVITVVS